MANQYIIDVSSYNGVVNWEALKKLGVTGAIVKIIRKDLDPDNQFYRNVQELERLGMPWGVYNYTYAATEAKAISDGKLYCDMLGDVKKDHFVYGAWMDMENAIQKKLTKAQNAAIINAAQETVEGRGYTFGCYTGMSFYGQYIDGRKTLTNNWWIARYYLDKTQFRYMQAPNEKYKPTLPQNIVAWQYTSNCKTAGLMTGRSGLCDQSILYRIPAAPTKKEEAKVVKIGSARIDERGKVSGGSAGDQTGKEVSAQEWYLHSKGWYVLRPKDPAVAEKIAKAMEWACANNNIGYDQKNRNSLWLNVASKGYRTDLATKCETDCSALVRVCLAYAGIGVKDFNTATEKNVIMATGKFEQMIDTVSKSQDYMKRGDILVTKSKGHTVVVLSNGSKVTSTPTGVSSSTKKGYSGTFPALPPRGYYQYGDGKHTLTNYLTQIKRVQEFLNWAVDAKLVVDGHYGDKTAEAVREFQKAAGFSAKEQDAMFGKKTLEAAKKYRK